VACGGGSEAQDAQSADASEIDASIDASNDAPNDAVPASTDESTIEVDKTFAMSGGEQVTVTVTARDSLGAPLAGASVQLVVAGTSNVIAQPPPTDATGKTTAMWASTVAGSITIEAIINGTQVSGPTVTFAPGPATKLGFRQQPSLVIAGAPFSPAVSVETQDAYGNHVDTNTGEIALSLDANPGATALYGTAYVAVQNGIAVFSATHVDVAAASYSLRAQSSTGLSSATSAFFDVTGGSPSLTYSTLVVAPASLEANGVDATQVRFKVANAYGVAIRGLQASLSVSGANNTLAPASGTTDSDGELVATLSSSTAEVKTVTGMAGSIMVTGSVHFAGPSCKPMIPGKVTAPFDDFSTAFHVADVDGDGVLDALVSVSGDLELYVFLGVGDGTFAAPIRIAIPSGSIVDIDSGDFNADGDRDLVLSISGTSALTLMLGDGTGQFPTTLTTTLPNDPTGLVVADLDGNGALDVLVTVPNAQKMFAELGGGNGTFTAGGTIDGGGTSTVVLDANSDGALDVVFASSSALIALGVGNGTFQSPTTATTSGGRILAGDFNNDAKPDLALASYDGLLTPYLGNGNGTFTAASAGVAYRGVRQPIDARGGAVQDLDGDNIVDIIVGAGLATSVLKGSGTGTFTRTKTYYAPTEVVADMTGDGHADLVGRAGLTVSVAAGTSSTAFVAPTEIFQNLAFNAWLYDAAADFDNNGHLDYVRWRSEPTGAMSVLLTQLNGSIVEAPTSAATQDPYDAVAGDFSGDGNPDLAIVKAAVNGVTLGLATGNGTGSLSAFSMQNVASPYVTTLDVGDFNQDGKQDLALARSANAGISISLSTGSGFGALQTYTSPSVGSVIVRDVSYDGVPDVIVTGGSGFAAEIRVYIATGTGTLMLPVSYGTEWMSGVVGIGDLTSDGIVDLVFLQGDLLATPRAVLVYPGLGAGAFGAPTVTPNVRIPKNFDFETVHVADVTSDGKADLLVHSNHGTAVIGSFGDGYVRQTPLHYAVSLLGGTPQTDSVVLSDHDANGLADFVYWNAGLVLATNAGCAP
jgi:hypothetical protein